MHSMPTIFISAGCLRFVPVSFLFLAHCNASLQTRRFVLINHSQVAGMEQWHGRAINLQEEDDRLPFHGAFLVHEARVGGGHFALTGRFHCLSPGNSGILTRMTIVICNQILPTRTPYPIDNLTTPFLPTLPLLDNSQRRSHQLTRSSTLQNFNL